MNRVCVMQQWCGLSETAMERSPYEIASMKRFAGLFLGGSSISNKTTIFNFRHLRKANKPTEQIFALIHQHLLNKGLCLHMGTVVDATIIAAPSPNKNASGTPPQLILKRTQ